MSNNKRNSSAKGYYIALILCAAAIGITGYVYNQNQNQEVQQVIRETQSVLAGTLETEENVAVLATQPEPVPAAVQEILPEIQEPEAVRTVCPVSGQTLMDYSMEALSYNETTRDWRVHNGVDLAANEGAEVMAAMDGTVSKVYEDETMGHTVEIRHTGGYTTSYASLMEAPCVSVGDTVSAGQTLGYAGSTALVETAMGSHVHFSVTCRNQPMDPVAFLALGE